MPTATSTSSTGPEAASSTSSSNSTAGKGAAAAQQTKESQHHGPAMREAMTTCVGLKEQYDRCFNHWYRHHFLQGEISQNCLHFFEDYRACLLEELHGKGLGHLEATPPI